jgi:hypothetical protein
MAALTSLKRADVSVAVRVIHPQTMSGSTLWCLVMLRCVITGTRVFSAPRRPSSTRRHPTSSAILSRRRWKLSFASRKCCKSLQQSTHVWQLIRLCVCVLSVNTAVVVSEAQQRIYRGCTGLLSDKSGGTGHSRKPVRIFSVNPHPVIAQSFLDQDAFLRCWTIQ